ncbi:MAG: replicative DNA helicase [Deltaproteobacteria bacterium]|nr:MAG: replicative DNA helicase [Deltaproteobacteria bacterium]
MSLPPPPESGRPLPQSLEAERVVLGGLMLDGSQVLSVSEILDVDDFFSDKHRALFRLLQEMAERDEPTEVVAVVERIVAADRAEEMGGLAYVSTLPDHVPSVESVEYYARIVRQRAVSRRLITAAREIADRALAGQDELAELLDFAESTVFQVTQQKESRDWHALSEVVDQEFVRIEDLARQFEEAEDGARGVSGVSTGFVDLDRKLAGLHPTDMVVLAARPAMGKTALALNIARNVAMQGRGVGVFSLEMSKGQLATRLLTSTARVDANKVRTGDLSRDEDWPRLQAAAEELYHLPLHIDDTPGLTITQIRSKCRRLKSQVPELGLIVVDYIGLMQGDPRVSRQEQVSASSRGLKAIAKELDVCVLALSQLNRGVESRPNKRPVMSDLRESGAIEQDADVIMFIYRDEYYNPETTTEPGVAEVIVAKQRNGATGTVKLAFQGQFTLFGNLAHDVGYL